MVVKKTEVLALRMSPDDAARLRRLAEADDVTYAHVIRQLVRAAYAERFGSRPPKKKR